MTLESPVTPPPTFTGSLSRRLVAGLVLLIVMICCVAFCVIWLLGRPSIHELSERQQVLLGQNITLALEKQIERVEGIATTMGKAAMALPHEDSLYFSVLPQILNQLGSEKSLIAGGGYWPAPFSYDREKQWHSFFWRRDGTGELQFYGDFNAPDGDGYQHSDWYAPLPFFNSNEAFWSKSYINPVLKVPSITCSIPLWDSHGFEGVVTVDLQLDLLAKTVNDIVDGNVYAFVVDRNNKFVTYPDVRLVQTQRHGKGAPQMDYFHVSEFAEREPEFVPMAEFLERIEVERLARNERQIQAIDTQTLQSLNRAEFAKLDVDQILAQIWQRRYQKSEGQNELARFNLAKDIILKEPVSAIVFQMNGTNWKVITVFPRSAHDVVGEQIIRRLILALGLSTVLFGFAAYMLLRKNVLRRLQDMSRQLKNAVEENKSQREPLRYSMDDEIGELVYWFNRRDEQLVLAQRESERAHKIKSDFLAKMSHEFRTPLNSIIGFSRRLLRKSDQHDDIRSKESLQSIYRAAMHQLDLVNDILDHSAVESDTVDLRFHRESVNEWLNIIEAENRPKVVQKGLVFNVDRLQEDKLIYCDLFKLKKVLSSLIGNAVRATQVGKIDVKVSHSELDGKPAVELLVIDSGHGISQSDRDKLFQPFTKLDTRISSPGAGLGLYLARFYTELHQGVLTVEAPGLLAQGAIFKLLLPTVN